MKVVALVCLLFVAGSCALPASEVAPSQERFVADWIQLAVQQWRFWVILNGWDPINVPTRSIHMRIIDDLLEVTAEIERLWFSGASGMRVNYAHYNIVFGRLDADIEIPELFLSMGKLSGRLMYGETDFSLAMEGTLFVRGIRLSGHAVLQAWPGHAKVLSIDPVISIDDIQSSLTVVGSRDYTEGVNDFLNIRLPELLIIYRGVISTVVGEIIRIAVDWYWG